MHPSVGVHPFPHVMLDALWSRNECITARHAFDRVDPAAWHWFDNGQERKAQAPFSIGGPIIRSMAAELASSGFREMVGAMFGIPDLTFDELGGGLHRIVPGGHLDVHVDFNRHDDGRYRRVNCLVFLNDDPHPSADLQLRYGPDESPRDVHVAPIMARTVLFATGETSWHGHPHPLQGTEERRSLAAYYYTAEPPPDVAGPHSTIFA